MNGMEDWETSFRELEAERDRLKAELEINKEVCDLNHKTIEEYQTELHALKSLAEKMREALSWISEEYERGERKGYDMKMTPQMNGLAKEALAIYESMKEPK